jgi:hypothetical protein
MFNIHLHIPTKDILYEAIECIKNNQKYNHANGLLYNTDKHTLKFYKSNEVIYVAISYDIIKEETRENFYKVLRSVVSDFNHMIDDTKSILDILSYISQKIDEYSYKTILKNLPKMVYIDNICLLLENLTIQNSKVYLDWSIKVL